MVARSLAFGLNLLVPWGSLLQCWGLPRHAKPGHQRFELSPWPFAFIPALRSEVSGLLLDLAMRGARKHGSS